MKPIRRTMHEIPDSLHDFLNEACDGCGRPIADDFKSMITHKDIDKGDHIERRSTGHFCGECVDKGIHLAEKHTPAPWLVGDDGTIRAEDGRVICHVSAADDVHGEYDKNSHVLSAGPELASVLRSMITWGLEPDPQSHSPREQRLAETWKAARALLSKLSV